MTSENADGQFKNPDLGKVLSGGADDRSDFGNLIVQGITTVFLHDVPGGRAASSHCGNDKSKG